MQHSIIFRGNTALHLNETTADGTITQRKVYVRREDKIDGVTIQPYVHEGVEMADLILMDGCRAVGVPFGTFQFYTEGEPLLKPDHFRG
jgi:hypothetical protein